MCSHCFSRLLECLEIACADLLWVVPWVHPATLKLLPIHVELNMTACTCHTLVIGLVSLHLKSLVLVATASRVGANRILLLVLNLPPLTTNHSPTVRSLNSTLPMTLTLAL